MRENFEIIRAAFENAGIDITKAEYSITAYSLNTDLSFKFNNLEEFLQFLELNAPADENKIEEINSMMVKEGVDNNNFFYVNFYKPKVAEL